jgi:CHAT domain-containing protein/tetratricopeptide (TPR) repeat protein
MQTANALYARYQKLVNKGRFREALPIARRFTAIVKRLKGGQSVEHATCLNEQGVTWSRLGFYAKALPLVLRALRIKRAVLGPKHGQVAFLNNNVAAMYRAQGDYERAEKSYRRGLASNVQRLGPHHPVVAHNLRYLADMFVRKGSYGAARRLFLRALAIYRKAYGEKHLQVAVAWNSLADLDKLDGHYERAEVQWKRCLGIMVKVKGAGHEETATIQNNIAGLLQLKGDYRRAEKRYRLALAIYRKRLGGQHPFVTLALNNLASNFHRQRRYAEAELLYKRVLRVREKTLAPDHPWVGLSLNNLAAVYLKQRLLKRAEPLLRRAYAIAVKRYGKKSLQISTELNNLAVLHYLKGEYKRSEKLYRQALRLLEPRLGKEHPELAVAQRNLANTLVAAGKGSEAWTRRQRAFRIGLARAERLLPLMSERARELYLAKFLEAYQMLLTQAVRRARRDPKVARQALSLALGYKGLLLGSLRRQRELVYASKDLKLRRLLEARNGAVRYLNGLVDQGQGRSVSGVHRLRLKRARQGLEQAEAQLARATAGRIAVPPRPTAKRLVRGLRPGAALVELVRYAPYQFRATWKQPRWGAARYAAFVLRTGGGVSLVDLGSARKLDKHVQGYLQAVKRAITVSHRRGKRFAQLWLDRWSRPIYQQIFAPLLPKLAGVKRLWIGPAGTLSLVPLGALAQPSGRYLAERFELHLLSSGRDLLRRALAGSDPTAAKRLGARGAVALVAPAYGRSQQPMSFRALRWNRRLTRRLRQRLGAILRRLPRGRRGGVTVLSGRQATETRLREIKRPLVLHLYTHGFYRPDLGPAGGRTLSGSAPRSVSADPMRRSGVALAGANVGGAQPRPKPTAGGLASHDDGILTAVEAGTLELAGTELVLLGACQTGVGETRIAQGVYGLRRALLYAGARSLLVSLWTVPEKQTRQLLFAFLEELGRGRSRYEALRRAQARIRAGNPLPYYWAGFVLVGEPGRIE